MDFATNKVKELASEPAKVKDGAKQILQKLASSKTTIPDNLMKLLCTMAGVPVPQPGDEGAGAVEMGSPKVADLKTAPRSARRDSLEDTVKAKRAEDHAEADADVSMDGSGVVGVGSADSPDPQSSPSTHGTGGRGDVSAGLQGSPHSRNLREAPVDPVTGWVDYPQSRNFD